MWCIAELDQPYIERMEDVLAIYEKPYNPAQPVSETNKLLRANLH
jgi:hypothetical protein